MAKRDERSHEPAPSTDADMPGASADPPADEGADDVVFTEASGDTPFVDTAPDPGATGTRTCHHCSAVLRAGEGVMRGGQWYCSPLHAYEGAGGQGDVAVQDRP